MYPSPLIQRSSISQQLLSPGKASDTCSLGLGSQVKEFADRGNLLRALKECSQSRDLEGGKTLHIRAIESGLLPDTYILNSLITMYAKCGSMADAQKVFDDYAFHRDVVSWNALIQGYVDNGDSEVALSFFDNMEEEADPNARTFVAAVTACSTSAYKEAEKWLEKGKSIHAQIAMDSDTWCNAFVGSALLDMYGKYGRMDHARCAFENMVHTGVMSWNAILQGYLNNGKAEMALRVFDSMVEVEDYRIPDFRTYLIVLSAYSASPKLVNLGKVRSIHSQAVMNGCCFGFLVTKLISMYADCGRMVDARVLFESIVLDVGSWNALIQGYVDNGQNQVALQVFDTMEEETQYGDCSPNGRTYVAVLGAYSGLAKKTVTDEAVAGNVELVEKGKAIHSRAVWDCCNNTIVENTLLLLYAACGKMEHASSLFDNMSAHSTVSCNILMKGYVDNREAGAALKIFYQMEEVETGSTPDGTTFVAALTACADLAGKEAGHHRRDGCKWLEEGKAIHSQALAQKCCDLFVESALVDMYGKCGSMVHARSVFDSMAQRDEVSWTALVMGYLNHGENELALQLIAEMKENGFKRDVMRLVAGLMTCGNLMALEVGRVFHEEAREYRLDKDAAVATSLIDFYGKCGCMEDAKQVFDNIPQKTRPLWNALMSSYALQGQHKLVFEAFDKMEEAGVRPCAISFANMLNACVGAGITDKGKKCFEEMASKYNISPDIIHYTLLVDLLGRANQLDEALKLIRMMPVEADLIIWTAFLSACWKWKDVAAGRVAYEALLKLDEKHGCAYALMGNIYKAKRSWKRFAEVKARRRRTIGTAKPLGKSCWTDKEGKVHKFISVDQDPQVLEPLLAKFKEQGFVQ